MVPLTGTGESGCSVCQLALRFHWRRGQLSEGPAEVCSPVSAESRCCFGRRERVVLFSAAALSASSFLCSFVSGGSGSGRRLTADRSTSGATVAAHNCYRRGGRQPSERREFGGPEQRVLRALTAGGGGAVVFSAPAAAAAARQAISLLLLLLQLRPVCLFARCRGEGSSSKIERRRRRNEGKARILRAHKRSRSATRRRQSISVGKLSGASAQVERT